MISEHKFAASYTSFWRAVMPLGDAFVRHMNSRLQPFLEPYEFECTAEMSALLSEVGYRLLLERGVRRKDLLITTSWSPSAVRKVAEETSHYLGRLKGFRHPIRGLSEAEVEIATNLAERLRRFFLIESGADTLLPMPRFEGCGIVGDCYGDVLVGSVLYEIKNVERSFRLVDVRQVLTYCSLNNAKELYRIDGIGWANARSGKFYRIGLDTLSRLVAGTSTSELLSDIVNFMSTDQASP